MINKKELRERVLLMMRKIYEEKEREGEEKKKTKDPAIAPLPVSPHASVFTTGSTTVTPSASS